MKDRKGFTLVELLAIIVILAVIMVIAVPQILNVVNGSKNGAWKSNVGMVKKAIVANAQLFDPETGVQKYSIGNLCSNPSKFSEIVKLEDTNITCSGNVFTLTGTGQFEGKSATITCTNNKCSVSITNTVTNVELAAGLYDDNNNLIASWDELINIYHMNLSWITGNSPGFLTFFSPSDMENMSSEWAQENGLEGPGWYLEGEEIYTKVTMQDILSSENPIAAPGAIIWTLTNAKNSKLIIPGTITTIPGNAFMGSSLDEIIIQEGVLDIYNNAFENSEYLKRITFPSSILNIDGEAFSGCPLESVKFGNSDNWKAKYKYEGGYMYVPSNVLSDSASAANFLKNNYCEITTNQISDDELDQYNIPFDQFCNLRG